jgi:hypothetical protein
MNTPLIPVSWGELLDKISILEIKSARIDRAEARANVRRELALLQEIAADVLHRVEDDFAALKRVNEALWEIEDDIRREEALGRFESRFIGLARQVYIRNDERAAIKRRINDRLGSELREEKSYADLRRSAILP